MNNTHVHYMKRCIQLAKNGLGSTYPNPLVGSVIVHNNKIIGEGWHYKAGDSHAEVNAIRSVTNKPLLKEATIYVSLEPCSHFGKTPPCSDLIIKSGIKTVIIGTADPFSKVSGAGIQKLKAAGCNVITGVLEKECQVLNSRFFCFHLKNRPFIILKWAQTNNGYIVPDQQKARKPVWITNKHSRQLSHQWRAEEQAILVGSNTVIKDNPRLTIRNFSGDHPIRIVIDRSNRIPEDSSILQPVAKTIIITGSTKLKTHTNTLTYETVDPKKPLIQEVCRILFEQNIQSVIIEGGAKTLKGFIENNCWDEARVCIGNTSFSSGIKAPVLKKKQYLEETQLNDIIRYYKND